MGSGLIELVLRDGFGSREVEGRGLVEVEFGLGRAASGGHAGRPMGQVEVEEDALHGGREGDERDDPHLATAGGAQQREHFVDPGQELGPQHTAGSCSRRGAGRTRLIRAVPRSHGVGRVIG